MKKIIFSLFLFLLFNCQSFSTTDYSHIKVVEVIDGDTIRLENGELLRYIGIDTPEIRQKIKGRWVFLPAPLALKAKELNKNLVEGEYVKIEFDVERRDSHNRLLGYVFVDKVFVNEELLRAGLAVVYSRPPNLKYLNVFMKAQQEAKNDKKGLWKDSFVLFNQAKNFIGQIKTVRGRVLNCYCSKRVCFLNFNKDPKTDFTIVIFRKSFPEFYKRKINICLYYRYKEVEITGRIREHNGPQIIANTPFDINVISSE